MDARIGHNKDISVMHLNADWGYVAYIERSVDARGETTYQVVRVPLGNGFKEKVPGTNEQDKAI